MPERLLNPQTGFWGKLPTRGDFVSRGLPEVFRARWDGWASAHLAGRAHWPDGGLRLRIAASGRVALGLALPSRDAIGRHFPLALFVLADALPAPALLEPWCDAALAVATQPDPDALWRALRALPPPCGAPGDATPLLLWRRGQAAIPADPASPGPALALLFN